MVSAHGGGGGGSNQAKKKPDALAALMAQIGAITGTDVGSPYAGELPSGPDYGTAAGNYDYYGQAQSMYQPQFSYLDKLAADAQARAKSSGAGLKTLYDSLRQSILGQEKGIKGNYGQGIQDAGAAYNDALASVEGQFDQTRNNSADVLARLGIQEAGSNVVGKSNQMEALLTSILGANQLGTTNALRQGQQAAVTYNKQQAGAAGLAGAEAQTGLQRQLADFMNQLAGKKAELQSQVQQSAFGMQQDAQKTALQQAQEDYKRMIDERDFNYRVAKDKADYDLRARTTQDKSIADPVGQMQQLAMQLYGNDRAASNAVMAITAALGDTQKLGSLGVTGNGKPTLGQLLNVLKERLGGDRYNEASADWSNLQRLASLLYK